MDEIVHKGGHVDPLRIARGRVGSIGLLERLLYLTHELADVIHLFLLQVFLLGIVHGPSDRAAVIPPTPHAGLNAPHLGSERGITIVECIHPDYVAARQLAPLKVILLQLGYVHPALVALDLL